MTNRDISDHIPPQVGPNGTSLQSTSHTGENTASTGGHPKTQTTFSDLPAELRNMIWHEALAPRVIMIYPCDSRVETDSLNQVDFDKIPGMLFANQESRRIALHHYDQRFTLTFTKPNGRGRLMRSRIPVIMSSHDELAFPAHNLSSVIEEWPRWSISVEAADGAPTPWIKRFSLLGDRLMREGIKEHNLARILDPDSHSWHRASYTSKDHPWYINCKWRPHSDKPDFKTFGPHLEDLMEGAGVHFVFIPGDDSVRHWMQWHFNIWCRLSMLMMDRYWLDACVVELPQPLPLHLDRDFIELGTYQSNYSG